MFTCAVAPLFDQAGRLAGAVNITSCREDLERTAHQLALAVTAEAVRRMEGAIFRVALPPRLDRQSAGRRCRRQRHDRL